MKIYALGFQSVDPEEASVAGIEWRRSEDDLWTFVNMVKDEPDEVDFELFLHEIETEGEVADILRATEHVTAEALTVSENDTITRYLDEFVWSGGPTLIERVVVQGSKYPGGELRRVEKEEDE